jgi:flagellar basal body-associated protein FliL
LIVSPTADRDSAPPPFSPTGYFILVVVMVVEAVAVYFLVRGFGQEALPRGAAGGYVEVGLGTVRRELSPASPASALPDVFAVEVVLVLDPRAPASGEFRRRIEERRNEYRHIVAHEILSARSESELRRAGALDALAGEIRGRLNRELSALGGGQEMIDKVIFPWSSLPVRR